MCHILDKIHRHSYLLKRSHYSLGIIMYTARALCLARGWSRGSGEVTRYDKFHDFSIEAPPVLRILTGSLCYC